MKNNKFVLGLLLGLTFFLFMGAFTRDWSESVPTDNTVANQIDDYNRYIRVDMSDRLKSQVYGLTAGENSGNPGFKKQILLQQGSAPGTPNADEIIFYSIDDGSNCSWYAKQEDGYVKQLLKKVGSDINFVIEAADIPADLIDSQHYVANSIDPEHLVDDFTFDTFPLSPSAAPDANYELANKKYVDDHVGHDGDGYVLRDVDGTPTKVYTKYLTGTLDADSETNVAHGVTAANILHISFICYKSSVSRYLSSDFRTSDASADAFLTYYDSGNVVITNVGSNIQGNAYKIKIDYIL